MENTIQLHDKKFRIMIPAEQIDKAVDAVAQRINADYAGKETPLFVYCYSGARSGQAVHVLRRMGYVNVKNIGGIATWTGAVER